MNEEKYPFGPILPWIVVVIAAIFIVGILNEALFLISAASDLSVAFGGAMLVVTVFSIMYLGRYVQSLVKGK